MRGDETLDALASIGIGVSRATGDHAFEDDQELFRDIIVVLIAGVMECDQDFIGQPTGIPGLGFVGLSGLVGELVDSILINHWLIPIQR